MPKKEKLYDNTHSTSNSTQLAILKKHFPNCFDKEGNFMSHKMEEIVGEAGLELSKESYALNWLGKSYARLLANENPRTLLKEDKVHNAKEAHKKSENLLIKGDNLEVLKHLSNAYSESIKMIYIDPPYNTGGDGFVYNDDRKFTVGELSRLAGIDEDEAGRILEFTSSKSNSHSAWLTFMYPRLYVARELLREDGVIFISIDDNEVSQLKLLCDEVFGEENFVGEIPTIMNLKGNQDNFGFAETHEYFLVYAKDKEKCHINKFNIEEEELLKVWQEDDFGLYKEADNLRATGENAPRNKRPNLWYPIFLNEDTKEFYVTEDNIAKNKNDIIIFPLNPDQEELSWYWGKNTFNEKKYNLILKNTKNGWQFYRKQRPDIGDVPTKKPKSFFYKSDYSTSTATTQLKNLMGTKLFKGPKPVPFIKDLLIIGLNNHDIILDFFAGSGTTAHAVMALNAEDGGKRKFITVQIPEKTDEKSEAYKAGYNTIFDITKARIEKASEKLGDKSGFKIFETTPVFEGYMDDIAELGDDTKLFNGNDLSEDELETLLVTWKAYDGAKLTEPLEVVMLGDYTAQYGANTLYFMQKGFSTEALKALMAKLDEEKTFEPSKLVLFGYNFESKYQRELSEALKVYTNKKEIDLEMVVRY